MITPDVWDMLFECKSSDLLFNNNGINADHIISEQSPVVSLDDCRTSVKEQKIPKEKQIELESNN